MKNKINIIKKKLKNKTPVFGTWSHLPNAQVVEIIGDAGCDFIVIDMEHGPHSYSDLSNMYLAAESRNMLPITRVSSINNSNILRCLDNGSKGIIVPHVDSYQMAKKAVNLMNYGAHDYSRGVSTLSRASDFDITNEQTYLRTQNKKILSCLIIEDKGALRDIDKIMKIKNLDLIFVGIYDLAQSLKINSKNIEKEMKHILKMIIQKGNDNNISVGTYAPNSKRALQLVDMGIRFITINVDGSVLRSAYNKIFNDLK
jgi:4-hydroxy-2-oxoheptanedioate aldolase